MSKTINRIKLLVIKQLESSLDEDEQKYLDDWMNESPLNREAIEEFLHEDSLRQGITLLYQTRNKVWKRIEEKLSEPKVIPIRRRRWKWTAAAAIIIVPILIGIGTISYRLFIKDSISDIVEIPPQAERFKNDVSPGGNKAMLTLADGHRITLDSIQTGNFAQQGNTKIIKLDNGQLLYSDTISGLGSEHILKSRELQPRINTLTTPCGGQYQLTLADGTRAWLNAASAITFPSAFNGNERRVEIKGEVYFEVAENKKMPFIVEVNDKAEVKVLGTHFNINAYDDEHNIKTTLLEGSVNVSSSLSPSVSSSFRHSVTLMPGEQASLNEKNELHVKKVEINEIIAWKDGIFQFNETDLKTVMRKLARWYDVEVEFRGKVPVQHFGGAISRQSNLSQVLKMLEISGVYFEIEGRKVIIMER